MAARTGMANLIHVVRMYAEAGLTDYNLTKTGGTIVFWSDDEVQRMMDMNRVDIVSEQLMKVPTNVEGGSIHYLEYRSRYGDYEETDGGTATFVLRNTAGSIIGTALYSVDYRRGVITFGSTTGGSTYLLTGRSYNLAKAAGDIWRAKAAHVADRYDFQTGEVAFDRSQLMKHYIKMADYYEGEGGPSTVKMHRSDAP